MSQQFWILTIIYLANFNLILGSLHHGSEKVHENQGSSQSSCHGIIFYGFIAAASASGVLTLLMVIALISVCVAKNKMKAAGKRLPKKFWEGQTNEECTTTLRTKD